MQSPDAWLTGEGDAYFQRNKDCSHTHDPVEALLPWLPKSKVLVELGCGDGWRSPFLSSLADWYIGIDASQQAINHAIDHYSANGVTFQVADAQNYQVPSGTTLVILSYVLHWLPNPEALIQKLCREVPYLLINEFAPDVPKDVPYIHREGLTTKKRPWRQMVPGSQVVSLEYSYPGSNERCACTLFRTEAPCREV